MKIKVFYGANGGLENEINQWLSNNKIEIRYVFQTPYSYQGYTTYPELQWITGIMISIFYEDKI